MEVRINVKVIQDYTTKIIT